MKSSDHLDSEMARLQAQVKDETQTWLKVESIRRKVTIGELIDQLVEAVQSSK
jgi:hypothetical protein